MAQTFYRIVRSDAPTPRDFMSFQELGQRPRNPDDPEVVRRWDKVSMWDDEERARKWARLRPRLGAFIARVDIPSTSTIAAEATGAEGHFSVAATGAELWQYVTSIIPV